MKIEAALLYQPLGARWAAELLRWNTPEIDLFRRLYEGAELAPEVLATDLWHEPSGGNPAPGRSGSTPGEDPVD